MTQTLHPSSSRRRSAAMELAACLSGVLLGLPAQAVAQVGRAPEPARPAGQEAETNLDEIVVTARRRSESLQDVPVAVSAFDAEDLEARGVSDIGQVAASVPNLTFTSGVVAGAGSSSVAQVYIRGVGQDDYQPATDPGVGIYLDGVYLGRTTGAVLSLLDVERVEVLRGPQGTLFGRNTIGGAISITSRAPSQDPSGSVTATVGERSLFELKGSFGGALSDTLSARLVGGLRQQDGLVTSSQIDGDFGNTDRWGVQGQLLWTPSPEVSVQVSADYSEVDQNAAGQVLTVVNTAATIVNNYNALSAARRLPRLDASQIATDPYRNSATNLGYDQAEIGGLTGTVGWNLNDVFSLKSISSYRFSNTGFSGDADSSSADFLNAATHEVDQTQFSQELQLSASTDRLDVLGGLYFFTEESDLYSVGSALQSLAGFLATGYCSPPPAGQAMACSIATNTAQNLASVQVEEVVTDNYAAFAQGTFKLTDQLSTTVGLRYSVDRKTFESTSTRTRDGFQNLRDPVTGDPTARREGEWDSLTPRLGLEWTPADDVLVYGSYATGFKSGTFNGRATSLAGLTKVEPEEADTYEIGLKTTLLDRRLRFNLAVFQIDYTNLQATVSLDGGVTAFVNAAAAESKGAELEIVALPADGLELGLSYGYTDATITESTNGAVLQGLIVGNRLPKTPEHKVSLFAEYAHTISQGELVWRADYVYQSEMFHLATNQQNSTTPAYTATLRAGNREPAYSVLNGRVTWTAPSGGWSVAAFGTNLTDERYALSRTATGLGFATAITAPPREFGLSLTVRR